MTLQVSLLSTGPKVWSDGECLRARTSIFWSVLTLGLCLKRFEANRTARTIRFERRLLWLLKTTRLIHFREVRDVTYKYQDMQLLPAWWSARDSKDCYTIGLELHDRSEVVLFSWMGEGRFSNETILPDWYYWDEFLFDAEGAQASESRTFFELLKRLLKEAQPGTPATPRAPGPPRTIPMRKPDVRPVP